MEKIALYFIGGPLSGMTYTLEKPETIVGNTKACDIYLESEHITSDYMRIYVGLNTITLVIKSSNYSAVLNNKLILKPETVAVEDVIFFPDGSIGYFQSDSEKLSVNIDMNNHVIAITGSDYQRFMQIPIFSVEYFCWLGYEKLYKEEYQDAEEYFNEAKKYNPYYAQIYRGLLFIEMQITSEEQILLWDERIENNSNYKSFMDYARMDEKMGFINRKQMLIYENNQTLYDEAMRIISVSSDPLDFEGAIRRLEQIPDFRDSRQISEKYKKESDLRRIQKKQWYLNIDNEQKKQKKRSSTAKTFLFFSFVLLIICCIMLIKKINSSKDKQFISAVLTTDNYNLDAVSQMVSEKYEESPNKYFELLKKAFTQSYLENNFSQMDSITNICLHSVSIANKFSEFLAFEYRDYAIDYLTKQVHDYVDAYESTTKITIDKYPILDNYALVSEVALKKTMDLLTSQQFEKALALLDFLDDKYDMSPIINSTIRPLLVTKASTYTLGSYNVEIKGDSYVFESSNDGKNIIIKSTGQVPINSSNNQSYSSPSNSTGATKSYSSSNNTGNRSSYSSNNDYGYGDPLPGESFSDYAKREDPDLWNDIEKQWDSLLNDGYGYGDPLPGESFSDYVKREDPDLWNDMENEWNSLFGSY